MIKDYCLWAKTQSDLLRERDFSHLDIDNVIEEIESMGRSERHALRNHLKNILVHKLKMQYQPDKHTRSWDTSVVNSRNELNDILEDNPSLKSNVNEILVKAYTNAIDNASAETGLNRSVFPEYCPWNFNQLIKE